MKSEPNTEDEENLDLFGRYLFLKELVEAFIELNLAKEPKTKKYMVRKIQKHLSSLNISSELNDEDLNSIPKLLDGVEGCQSSDEQEELVREAIESINNMNSFNSLFKNILSRMV